MKPMPEKATYSMEVWGNRAKDEWKYVPDNAEEVLERGGNVRFEMRVDGSTHTIDHGTQGELELAQMEARQLMESLMHYFNIEIR